MDTEELKNIIAKKRFLIECFLTTGKLQTNNDPKTILKHGVTNYYLSSVILELLIKILYELKFKKQAPFTHNILKIYDQLCEETKSFITSIYDEARNRKVLILSKVDSSVTFPPFHEILVTNEQFIKNFKYDAMGSKINSAIDNEFYSKLFEFINTKIDHL